MSAVALAVSVELRAQSAAIEEIIVTAQKRVESVQDVPVAIDVIGGDTLLREGVRDVKELDKMSTELGMNFPSGQATQIGIRGMQQTGNFAPTADTLAAVHMDGAFLSSFWGLNGLMYDIERVEVLSGPQGTLYGRNTAAGAINIITRRPGQEFAANGFVEAGSKSMLRLGGGVSVPMGERFAVRLAGQRYTRDALFNDGGNEQDQWGARLSGVWTITDRDEFYFTLDKSVFDGTNTSTTLLGVNPDARRPDGSIPASVTHYLSSPTLSDPYNVYPYTRQRNLQFVGDNEQENWGVMAQYTHDWNAVSAALQYSYRKLEGISRSATKTPAQFSGALLPNIITSNTVELRLLSNDTGAFEWVGGLFYTEADNIGWFATPMAQNGPDPVTGLDISWCPCSSGFFPNSGSMYSYAAYGQTTWTPPRNERLHLTAGLRYTFDYKDAFLGYHVAGVPVFAFGIPAMPAAVQEFFRTHNTVDISNGDNSRTWDAVQWRLGVQYDLAPSSMLYGSIATGYKSGGLTYGTTPELGPEDLLAYEFGSKNQFLGNTLQLNAAVWWYDYQNLEAGVGRPLGFSFTLPNGQILDTVGSTANVGQVDMAGFSVDFDWLVTDSDQLSLSLTHIYSRINEGSETLPNGRQNIIFHEGERLGDAPKWVVLGRYSHTFRLPGGASLNPALKYQWQSRKIDNGIYRPQPYFQNNRTTPEFGIPSRGILDFSLRFAPGGDRWDVTAYANNLTDELDVRTRAYDANPASATFGHITGTLGDPRTYGIIATRGSDSGACREHPVSSTCREWPSAPRGADGTVRDGFGTRWEEAVGCESFAIRPGMTYCPNR